jgi:hypothetical protein
MKDAIRAAVRDRRMPPYPADPSCNSYRDHVPLSSVEIATIQAWADAGAPEGDPSTAAPTVGPSVPRLPRVDLTLGLPAPYTPSPAPGEQDEYRCFLLDWPGSSDLYVTGYEVRPGEARVVHHAVASLLAPQSVAGFLAQHPGAAQGFSCGAGSLGGPSNMSSGASGDGGGGTPGGGDGGGSTGGGDTGGTGRTLFEQLEGQGVLAVWAPGLGAELFPAGSGLVVHPGSKIVLQIHYNLSAAGPLADQTMVDFQTESSVSTKALMMFWADPRWALSQTMQIPAGANPVSFHFEIDPTFLLSGGRPLTIHAAGLHMHQLGTEARLWLSHNGSEQCLLDIPRWDFHWQRIYDFANPVTAQLGDQLGISCDFDNSAAHQPIVRGSQQAPRDVNWGERTTDEMCLGFLYMTM